MKKKSLSGIIWIYTTMIFVTLCLLVFWIIYVVHSYARINELVMKMGGSGENYHWIVLIVGCILFIALIVGLSLQLAQNISVIRYNRKQDEFVANITHELKSPLAAIKLHGQTLLQGDVNLDEKKRFLSYILQQSERMTTLVDNVLEIGRLRNKEIPLNLEPVDVQKFFEDYFEETKQRVESHELVFKGNVKTSASILANGFAIHRIMDNLIDNAIKASKKGSFIGCLVNEVDHHLEIAVWDEGIGIPKKEQKNIFKRFYQIGSEIRGRRKGTGLGLAIVQGLVKEMKGNIKVVSQEGKKGTRFVIRFPIYS